MIRTVKDLIEELRKYPGHMRIGVNHADLRGKGSYLSNYIRLVQEEADSNHNYEFKNHKNENSFFFVDVLVIS
jgi:4-hydroxy-3-methylbut-2-en-1-yl diphosphate synthase IspG/GcpE